MSKKYFSKDTICIEAPSLSIEIDVDVEFTVTDYIPMTLTSPEEPCMVEDVELSFSRGGKPIVLPEWLVDEISGNQAFRDHLMTEAGESDQAAREDAAEARNEREWEDAR